MLKLRLLLLLLIIGSQITSAQQIDTIWYNNKWEKTTDIAARHYSRIIVNINKTKFLVKDFYETKSIQMMGYYSSLNPEIKNGNFTYWYRNGKVQMENSYSQNQLTKVIQYAENGEITNQWELIVIGQDKDGKDIIRSIEVAPKFPGGNESMDVFIKENIKYPADLVNQNIDGKVVVKFTVTSTGNISNVSVVKGLHPLLDRAVIAVVEKLPKWQPAKQDGKFVDVQMSIPVLFN